jgi:hypothetical protein
MNFARTPLKTPEGIYVEEIDLAMSMDRVAWFARQSIGPDVLSSSELLKEGSS